MIEITLEINNLLSPEEWISAREISSRADDAASDDDDDEDDDGANASTAAAAAAPAAAAISLPPAAAPAAPKLLLLSAAAPAAPAVSAPLSEAFVDETELFFNHRFCEALSDAKVETKFDIPWPCQISDTRGKPDEGCAWLDYCNTIHIDIIRSLSANPINDSASQSIDSTSSLLINNFGR